MRVIRKYGNWILSLTYSATSNCVHARRDQDWLIQVSCRVSMLISDVGRKYFFFLYKCKSDDAGGLTSPRGHSCRASKNVSRTTYWNRSEIFRSSSSLVSLFPSASPPPRRLCDTSVFGLILEV